MLLFNLKLAIRNLIKNKIYTSLIIGGFAIGFAAIILISLFYRSETTVNNGFPNHKNIYRIYDVKMNRCNLNWDLFPAFVNNYADVENACPLDYSSGMKLSVKNELLHSSTEIEYLLTTTNNFFSIFSVEMIKTLSTEPFKDRESVVISGKVAQALYGTENPLGQQINIGNYFLGTVSGIFKELPENSSFSADVILNSENKNFRISSTINNGLKYNPTNHFVMLKVGTNPETFAGELNKSITLKTLDVDSLALQKLDDIYLSKLTVKSRHAKGNPAILKIFLAIAFLILLLSSINLLNYSISMQYAKLKEIGINKSNGASRKDLIYYIFTEVTLGILISLIISVSISLIFLPYSEILFGKPISLHWADWLAVIPVFGGAVIFTILLNCLAPISILPKFKITEFLSGFKGKRNRRQLGRQALLSFQLTASTALIAVVMIIFKQLSFVKNSDLGFDREKLVRIDIPYEYENLEILNQEVAKLSFVKESTLSSGCPGMINHKMGSNTGEKRFDVNCIPVDKNFTQTIEFELLEGRDFIESEINKACLINEEAFKQSGWDSYEGKKINIGQESDYEVVGIIKNFKFESYYQTIEPLALLYTGAKDGNVLSARLSQGNIAQQINQIKQVWETISPDEPFSFMFYDEFFQSLYEKEEKLASSITFFSVIAIILTCMGILGQIFLISLNKIKEIGIRKVNGAKVIEILTLLNADFVKRIAIAFIIATPIAYFTMNKWLENFAYKTSLSWWIFILAGAMVLGIALLTVSWQSWRAATRNPVEALRYE